MTSQLVMMLNSATFAETDLSSLRVVFTGGEHLSPEMGRAFEARTGARILQFYGSNEAGPISVTRLDDAESTRLTTVGRPIPGQRVRLFDSSGDDVTDSGGQGQIASLGPGTSPGYYRDDGANAALFRTDGWQLTGDLGRIDGHGYLVLTGRAADLIIRGGQNISALDVEDEVGSHPRVAQVAVVGVPDPVLGERACAVVVTRDDLPLDLDDLCEHLDAQGISKHHFPERIELRAELPLNSGGKTDKQRLRRELADNFSQT